MSYFVDLVVFLVFFFTFFIFYTHESNRTLCFAKRRRSNTCLKWSFDRECQWVNSVQGKAATLVKIVLKADPWTGTCQPKPQRSAKSAEGSSPQYGRSISFVIVRAWWDKSVSKRRFKRGKAPLRQPSIPHPHPHQASEPLLKSALLFFSSFSYLLDAVDGVKTGFSPLSLSLFFFPWFSSEHSVNLPRPRKTSHLENHRAGSWCLIWCFPPTFV